MGMEHLDFRPVLLAWASVQAEVLGRKQCRRDGIGALIRKLRECLPANDGSERATAAQLLEDHCTVCGKCTLADIAREP